MPGIDPHVLSEMTGVDVRVLQPFLEGTDTMTEDSILEEVLALKPIIDAVGVEESEKIVSKLAKEGKHAEIIAALKERETEVSNQQKRGFLQWLFKGKEHRSHSADEEPRQRKPATPPRRNSTAPPHPTQPPPKPAAAPRTHTSMVPSESIRMATPRSQESAEEEDSFKNTALPAPSSGTQMTSLPSQPPPRSVELAQRMTQTEEELSRQYNFMSSTNRATTVSAESGRSETRRDDEFQAIFQQFLQGTSPK